MKARRVAGYHSARAAATALGVKPATYAAHENGTRTFSVTDARRYAELYAVSPGWILTGEQFVDDQANKVRDDSLAEPEVGNASSTHGAEFDARANMSDRDIFNFGKHALKLLEQLATPKEDDAAERTIKIGEVVIWRMLHEDRAPDEEQWEIVSQWQFPSTYFSEVLHVTPLDVAVLAIIDDNMLPTFQIDDRLIVDFKQKKFTVDGVYIFMDKDEKIHIQRIQREKALLKITNDNQSGSAKHPAITVDSQELEIIGRVCGSITAR